MKYIIGIGLVFFSLQGFCKSENEQSSLVCMQLIQVIDSAYKYKDQGKTKNEMLAPLPTKEVLEKYPESMSDQRRLGEQMIEVISDIYNHEKPPQVPYSAYRSESCYRATTNKEIVKDFASVLPKLLECGKLDKKDQYSCGFALAKP
jgi:hypothetical protein